MCFQAFAVPYENVAGLAMQKPVALLAHAKIRLGWPVSDASEAFQES
jgi:hypothetical protein